MRWLTNYASGSKQRKEHKAKQVVERIRVIDPGKDDQDKPVSVYWEGLMPRDELLVFDPQARCRTTYAPRIKRLATWWITPSFVILLVFAAIFLNAGEPVTALPIAIFGGVFLGLPVGLLAALVIVRRFLPVEAWWHIMRIETAQAATYDLNARDPADRWALMALVPRPLMATTEVDGEALATEIEQLLWRNEQLRLGQEGWATNNFLRGMGAARSREELLKTGAIQARPTLEKPSPNDRGGPR